MIYLRSFIVLITIVFSFQLLAGPQESGHVYRIINSPMDAMQLRVDLLQQARKNIFLSYFIFSNDKTSYAGLSLLREEARKGVRVKVLVDAPFNSLSKGMMKHLLDEGVELRQYHPFSLKNLPQFLNRMHDKILVIDGEQFIVGGRNVEDTYFGLAEKNYLDRDVFVKGDLSQSVEEYYLDLWKSDHVKPPNLSSATHKEVEAAARELDAAFNSLKGKDSLVRLNTGKDWAKGQKKVSGINFLHDHAGNTIQYKPTTALELAKVVESMKEGTIYIESPYLIPTKAFTEVVGDAIERGIHIRILTNSLKSTDGILASAGYYYYKKKLIKMGIELWEYQGPESLHAKSAVFGNKIAAIGTYNLDPLSETSNLEVAVLAQDESKAKALKKNMDLHLKQAVKVAENGERIKGVKPFLGVPKSKIIKMYCSQLLVPILKNKL